MNFVKTFPGNVLPAKDWILDEVGVSLNLLFDEVWRIKWFVSGANAAAQFSPNWWGCRRRFGFKQFPKGS
jgi:hypothetical protein